MYYALTLELRVCRSMALASTCRHTAQTKDCATTVILLRYLNRRDITFSKPGTNEKFATSNITTAPLLAYTPKKLCRCCQS